VSVAATVAPSRHCFRAPLACPTKTSNRTRAEQLPLPCAFAVSRSDETRSLPRVSRAYTGPCDENLIQIKSAHLSGFARAPAVLASQDACLFIQ
jgi:hypothetical protein